MQNLSTNQIEWQSMSQPNGKKTRDANFELLRILSMLMIIILHFNGHGGFMAGAVGANSIIFKIIHAVSIISVNLFVMITAYFMINKKIKWQKLVRLWVEVFFYSAAIYLIFVAAGIKTFEWADLFNFIPLISKRYWFVSSYFIFYLSIPLLNAMLSNLNQKQHALLCLGLIVLSLITFIPGVDSFPIGSGYNALWFMCLFVHMSFLKKHNKIELKWWAYLIGFLAFTVIIYFTGFAYSSPATLASAICIFMLFKKINIQKPSLVKTISFVSTSTFGVYLISDNNLVRGWMYENLFQTQNYFSSPYAVLIMLGFCLATFIGCALIDIARRYLFFGIERLSIKTLKNIKEIKPPN